MTKKAIPPHVKTTADRYFQEQEARLGPIKPPDLTKEQKTTLSGNLASLKGWIKQHKAEGLHIAAPAATAAFMAAIEAIERSLPS
jgi:hypothetical protein